MRLLTTWIPPALPVPRVLKLRFDRSRLETIGSLIEFIHTRSSYIAQTSLHGYLKTRMGTSYRQWFEDDSFSQSIRIASVRVFLSCLSDLTVFSVATAGRQTAVDDASLKALADHAFRKAALAGLAGQPERDDLDATFEAFDRRTATENWRTAAEGRSAFSGSEVDLVRYAPVIDEYRELDRDNRDQFDPLSMARRPRADAPAHGRPSPSRKLESPCPARRSRVLKPQTRYWQGMAVCLASSTAAALWLALLSLWTSWPEHIAFRALAIGTGVIVAAGGFWFATTLVRGHKRDIQRLRGSLLMAGGEESRFLGHANRMIANRELTALAGTLSSVLAARDDQRRLTEQRLTGILAALPSGVVVVTRSGLVSLVNDAARRTFADQALSPGTSVFAAITRESVLEPDDPGPISSVRAVDGRDPPRTDRQS